MVHVRLSSFGVQIVKALGYGHPHLSIITSVILAVLSLFYIFTAGSFFKADIFVLMNGTSYDTSFHLFVINKTIDHIIMVGITVIWLALSLCQRARQVMFLTLGGLAGAAVVANLFTSFLDIVAILTIPTIIILLIYNKFSCRKILNKPSGLSLTYLAIISVATSIITIFITWVHVLGPIPSSSGIMQDNDIAFDIFVLFSSISPVLMILLIYCFPIKLLAMRLMNKSSVYYEERINSSSSAQVVTKKYKFIYILLIMVLAAAMVVIPHLPTINRNNQLIGTDTFYYAGWQKNLTQSKSLQQFLHVAFVEIRGGDRPISLLFIFAFVRSVHADPSLVIDNLPIILGPALVLVIYLFTRELTSNEKASLLSALLTAVSFHVLIGIYAGYYANWIALIIGYFAFIILLKYLKIPSKLHLIGFFALMILSLLSHEYTWTILTLVMGIFLGVMLKMGYYKRRNTILLFLVILSTIIVDFAKYTIVPSPNGLGLDLAVANKYQAGIDQFTSRWSNLRDTMQYYYVAQFSNFIILILGLYWLFRCKLHEISTILIMIFLSVGIIPLLFGNWVVQSRVFYDIPFQIPAALGLSYIRRDNNGVIIVSAICIWLIAISLKNVSNFVSPP